MTQASALDLAPKHIRVNSINPAVIRTPIFERAGVTGDDLSKMYDRIKTIYPVGRPGEVSDTSQAIAFLADDKSASFLTGILLPVDGYIFNMNFCTCHSFYFIYFNIFVRFSGAMVAGVAF